MQLGSQNVNKSIFLPLSVCPYYTPSGLLCNRGKANISQKFATIAFIANPFAKILQRLNKYAIILLLIYMGEAELPAF